LQTVASFKSSRFAALARRSRRDNWWKHQKNGTGLPDFSWSKHTKMGKLYQMTANYTKRPRVIPNGHKFIPNDRKIYQHRPFQGPPKYTQTGHFGHKINHLATLKLNGKNKASLENMCTKE
jgi:hypothetical protein